MQISYPSLGTLRITKTIEICIIHETNYNFLYFLLYLQLLN